VIWNPVQQFKVDAESLHHRHKITPYDGEVLNGVVQKTFLRGRLIYDVGHFVDKPPGHMLLRKT
jgi:allantoinase